MLYPEGIMKCRDCFVEYARERFLFTKPMSEQRERVSFLIRKNEWIKAVQRHSVTSGEIKKYVFFLHRLSVIGHKTSSNAKRKRAGRKRSGRRRAEENDLPLSPSPHRKHYHYTRLTFDLAMASANSFWFIPHKLGTTALHFLWQFMLQTWKQKLLIQLEIAN